MYTMRDFFYKKNDIIIVLIILILAGFLIYNRINVILDYPAKLAEQQQAKKPRQRRRRKQRRQQRQRRPLMIPNQANKSKEALIWL